MDLGQLKGVKFLKATHPAIRNVNKMITLIESIRRDTHMVDAMSGEFDPLDVYLGKGTGRLCYAAWFYDDKAVVELVRRTVKFTDKPLFSGNQRLAPGKTPAERRKEVMILCVEAVLEKARADMPTIVDGDDK